MENNIMLDLETMGTSSQAAVIAIGAVRFDKDAGIVDTFYRVVDLGSSVRHGLKIEPDTVLWWMRQSDDARAKFDRPGIQLPHALTDFADWVGADALMWGNGASFDNTILSSAYEACGMEQPWKFWNDRCYRTEKSRRPDVKMERSGTHHCAVDDAESQARHLLDIWRSE